MQDQDQLHSSFKIRNSRQRNDSKHEIRDKKIENIHNNQQIDCSNSALFSELDQEIQQQQLQNDQPKAYRYMNFGAAEANANNPSPVRHQMTPKNELEESASLEEFQVEEQEQMTPIQKNKNKENKLNGSLEEIELDDEDDNNDQDSPLSQSQEESLESNDIDQKYGSGKKEDQLEDEFNSLKQIYVVIKSNGGSTDFEKARGFAKKVLQQHGQQQLTEKKINSYTQNENFTLIQQKKDENATFFHVLITEVEPSDFNFLLSFSHTSKSGSSISFQKQQPSMLTLRQVLYDTNNQKNQKLVKKYSSNEAAQSLVNQDNQVYVHNQQLAHDFNEISFNMTNIQNKQNFKDLAQLCCAFVNKDTFMNDQIAGRILIGVNEEGIVKGVQKRNQFQKQFEGYLYDTTLPSINNLIKIKVQDLEIQDESDQVIIDIQIQRNNNDEFISFKDLSDNDYAYYTLKRNKILPILTSQLCLHVPERISGKTLQKLVENLEQNNNNNNNINGGENQSQLEKVSPVTKRFSDMGGRYTQKVSKSLNRHNKDTNNSSVFQQQQQENLSSSPAKRNYMTEKREKRSKTNNNNTNSNNSQQHNIFKQNYSNNPILSQAGKRSQKTGNLPIAINDKHNISIFNEPQQQQSNFMQHQQQQQQGIKNNINLTSNNTNHLANNNQFAQQKNNLTSLPIPLKQNKQQAQQDEGISPLKGKSGRKRDDDFESNKSSVLVQRENMLNSLGFNNEGNFRSNNRKLQKINQNLMESNSKQNLETMKRNINDNYLDQNTKEIDNNNNNNQKMSNKKLLPINGKLRSITSQN